MYKVHEPILKGEYDAPSIWYKSKPLMIIHYGGSYVHESQDAAVAYAHVLVGLLNAKAN